MGRGERAGSRHQRGDLDRGHHVVHVALRDRSHSGRAKPRRICAALKPGQTVVADANRGWTVHGALRVCQGISHLNSICIEQPCDTYEECLLVRRAAPQPMILDECIDTVASFMRAWSDKALDGDGLAQPAVYAHSVLDNPVELVFRRDGRHTSGHESCPVMWRR